MKKPAHKDLARLTRLCRKIKGILADCPLTCGRTEGASQGFQALSIPKRLGATDTGEVKNPHPLMGEEFTNSCRDVPAERLYKVRADCPKGGSSNPDLVQ